MKPIYDLMRLESGSVANAYVLLSDGLGLIEALDALRFACEKLSFNLENVPEKDLETAAFILSDFTKTNDDGMVYAVSIWFGD